MKLEYVYTYLRDHIDQVAILCSVLVVRVGQKQPFYFLYYVTQGLRRLLLLLLLLVFDDGGEFGGWGVRRQEHESMHTYTNVPCSRN